MSPEQDRCYPQQVCHKEVNELQLQRYFEGDVEQPDDELQPDNHLDAGRQPPYSAACADGEMTGDHVEGESPENGNERVDRSDLTEHRFGDLQLSRDRLGKGI